MLAYARPKDYGAMPAGTPRQRLWSYKAVNDLQVGESTTVEFTLSAADLAVSNAQGDRLVHPGHEYELAFSDGAHEVKASLMVVGDAPHLVERSAFA